MDRSYLFAPGHNAKLLDRVFTAGADARDARPRGRGAAAAQGRGAPHGRRCAALAGARAAWVRVNAAQTDACAADLAAVAEHAYGIRIPKIESPDDVAWVAARAPGTPIICAIESARGVLAAQEIAAAPGVRHLAMGGVDLQRDLNTTGGNAQTAYARSHLVVVLAGGGDRPAHRQRLPAAGRRRRAAVPGRVRALAGLLRQVGDPPAAAAGAARGVHAVGAGAGVGAEVLEAFDAAGGAACGCPTASSSTCRWRSGRGGCCSWRRPCRGCSSGRGERAR